MESTTKVIQQNKLPATMIIELSLMGKSNALNDHGNTNPNPALVSVGPAISPTGISALSFIKYSSEIKKKGTNAVTQNSIDNFCQRIVFQYGEVTV